MKYKIEVGHCSMTDFVEDFEGTFNQVRARVDEIQFGAKGITPETATKEQKEEASNKGFVFAANDKEEVVYPIEGRDF